MTEVEKLKQEVDTLKTSLEQYKDAYDKLQRQTHELLRNRFGKKSERFIDPENKQLPLFANTTLPVAPVDELQDEDVTVTVAKRKKKKNKTKTLPRIIEIISLPDEDKLCECGCLKTVIRYETKELVHFKPSELYIIEQRREVVACNTASCEQSIITAPAPKQILPKIKATETLLAHTLVTKFHHRAPLYHQEKYMEFAGISRETLARWHISLMSPMQPLFNLMKDTIINYDIAGLDATTLQVLNEPGRKAETKSYLYCFRGGPPDTPVVLYEYNATLHKQFVDNWFEGFAGAVHMDADPWFELLLEDKHVFAAKCNAHARRKFEPIAKFDKDKKGLAYQAMGFYRAIYKIEKHVKQKKMTTEQRYEHRLKHSKPILDKLYAWLVHHKPLVLPASPLGKAMQYCLNHWDDLIYFLKDGRIEIDNNLTEQAIKPIVIARKNFMFANSVNGAKAIAMHMSFIRSALANNLNPYKYYVAIFKRLPLCETVEDYEKLLPWNIDNI